MRNSPMFKRIMELAKRKQEPVTQKVLKKNLIFHSALQVIALLVVVFSPSYALGVAAPLILLGLGGFLGLWSAALDGALGAPDDEVAPRKS